MNMPPECDMKDKPISPKCMAELWTVLNKTTGKSSILCTMHVMHALNAAIDSTFSIYPAKDYSIHGGHDLPARDK